MERLCLWSCLGPFALVFEVFKVFFLRAFFHLDLT